MTVERGVDDRSRSCTMWSVLQRRFGCVSGPGSGLVDMSEFCSCICLSFVPKEKNVQSRKVGV